MKFSLLSAFVLQLAVEKALGRGHIGGARNWIFICGQESTPGHPNARPECATAFAFAEGGYRSMSVLTHDLVWSSVTPLPNNVCGFVTVAKYGLERRRRGTHPWIGLPSLKPLERLEEKNLFRTSCGVLSLKKQIF